MQVVGALDKIESDKLDVKVKAQLGKKILSSYGKPSSWDGDKVKK